MSNRVKFTPEQKMFFVLKFRELKNDMIPIKDTYILSTN